MRAARGRSAKGRLDDTIEVRVDWYVGVLAILAADALFAFDVLPEVRALLLIVAAVMVLRRLFRWSEG